jgi:hypothetical protein
MPLGFLFLRKSSFTDVSEVIFDNIFSNDYKQYRFIFNISSSVELRGSMQFRTGGVNNSSSIYTNMNIEIGGSTFNVSGRSTGTSWPSLFILDNGKTRIGTPCEVLNPYQSTFTTGIGGRVGSTYTQGEASIDEYVYGTTASASFDGVRIIGQSANMTGSISVYGYRWN